MRRGRGAPAGHAIDPNAWMVTFGDLVTLLLTFFVLLLTMSSMDAQKARQVARSAGGTVMAAITGSVMENKELISSHFSALDDFREILSRKLYSADRELVDREEYKVRMRDKKTSGAPTGFVLGVEGRGLEGEEGNEVVVEVTPAGLRVELPESIAFVPGSAELTATSARLLDDILDALGQTARRYHLEAIVAGHTDDRPAGGALYPSNWELSCARASAIAFRLSAEGRVPPTLVAAAGYGGERPVADNSSAEGRARNRRVEILLRVSPSSALEDKSQLTVDYKALEPAAPTEMIEVEAPKNLMGLPAEAPPSK
ncbi:MAG: OmpA family protein [Deltaproteobacteria bacterium]|nr:OmpA family protein [Deltaproteobacteria bacterium]